VGAQLVVAVVMKALDGRLLDGAVHPFDLAIGPWVVRLGQPVLDPIRLANHVEAHGPGIDGVAVPGLFGELNAIVGQDRVDLVRHGFEHVLKELPGSFSVSRCNELSDGELGCPVYAHKEKELALGGLHLSYVDVEEAYGVTLELLALGLVPFDIWQARDAVPLQAPVQR